MILIIIIVSWLTFVAVPILGLYRLIPFYFKYKKTSKWDAIGNTACTPLGSIPILH